MQAIWKAAYDAGVDVVLAGHTHNYERFAPQGATGALNNSTGVREFVVGTGGANFASASSPIAKQPGPPEHYVRRARALAARHQLRLAVRSRGGEDVHRLGLDGLSLTNLDVRLAN